MPTTTILLRVPVLLVVLLLVVAAVGSFRTVKFLPGFSGPLPFVLETGYVGVGNSEEFECPEYEYLLATYWINDDRVRKALHIHEGSIGEWVRCKDNGYYVYERDSVFPYHVNLSSEGYRSLIFSGDHDMKVPHMETQAWIKSLNYSIVDDWRPWFIEDDVAGYTRSYANNMTFASIKGGGHTPQYTRKECSILFNRWIVGESL